MVECVVKSWVLSKGVGVHFYMSEKISDDVCKNKHLFLRYSWDLVHVINCVSEN